MKVEKICFLVGILFISYPFLANRWNSYHHSRVISHYEEAFVSMNQELRMQYYDEAVEYNKKIEKTGIRWNMTEKEREVYRGVLDMHPDGMMGYIEIPSIRCRLPIYHGTDEGVLQAGVGHLEGTSLPIGGSGSHCVLSGHRGLPSSKLFTGLDQVKKGDRFFLHVLGYTVEYEVDQIQVVLPENTKLLQIEENRALCTLVTCTPYGINTHRLLITGFEIGKNEIGKEENVEYIEENKDEDLIEQGKKVLALALCVASLLLFVIVRPVHGQSVKNQQIQNNNPVIESTECVEIQLEYPISGTQFRLYRLEKIPEEDLKGEYSQEKILVSSKVVKKDGRLCFTGVLAGTYYIEGDKVFRDGYWYIPAATEICIDENMYGTGGRIVVRPKYEKKLKEDKTDSTEEQPEEEQPEEELPQTGQLWWPVLFGTIGGFLCLLSGKQRKK